MEVKSRALNYLQRHHRKLLVILSSTVALYFLGRYVCSRMFGGMKPKKREPIKDFPTIEDIQRFVEGLPFEAVKTDNAVTLRDLLGELSEFSEDEDWKELIASVHSLYQEPPAEKGQSK